MKRITEKEYNDSFRVNDEPMDQNSESIQREAIQLALDTRKFEIQLYWRRAAYFWTFIAAAFAAFGTVQTVSDPDNKILLSIIVCCLGFLFSCAWYLVNRGSKFWQENWENHVALLEDNVYGPLFKTVISRDEAHSRGFKNRTIGPAAYSVSKINQIVSLYVTFLWILLLIISTPINFSTKPDWRYISPIAITIIFTVLIFRWGKSDRDEKCEDPDHLLKPMKYESKIEDK